MKKRRCVHTQHLQVNHYLVAKLFLRFALRVCRHELLVSASCERRLSHPGLTQHLRRVMACDKIAQWTFTSSCSATRSRHPAGDGLHDCLSKEAPSRL